MLKNVTLGQFFPGQSFIHKLDPRTKLISAMVFLIAVFLVKNFWGYLIMGFALGLILIVSKIPIKIIFRGLKPLIFIIIFTAILNIFYTKGPDIIATFWVFTITKQGIIMAVFMAVRIIFIILFTTLLISYTTSPLALTDALERLMTPLKKIKFPVHEFSLMMTIALRFIPTLIEETDKIMSAQKARGADFETGGLIKRSKALIPILIPLFVSAFRRADDLAMAMESRCYTGGEGRTHLKIFKFSSKDLLFFVFNLIIVAGVFLVNMI